jgi:A/G-specific adenine glycosylase
MRSFPWRETGDPYHVLVAEVMLQRTRAEQVVPVYRQFISRYPSPESCANAHIRDLKRLLRSLGLHSRATTLKKLALDVQNVFNGTIPSDRNKLKQISGVGDYVAGAVLSVAFNRTEWMVDSNIVRIFTRFTGIKPTGEMRRSATLIDMAQEYSQTKAPRNANLALLDHAALICSARLPKCTRCPLKMRCHFFATHPEVANRTSDDCSM